MGADSKQVEYPYLPEGKMIKYVSIDNVFMHEAFEYAQEFSLDKAKPNASVLVKDGIVIGRGANGSNYHLHHECERVKQKIPTGQGYDLCEGCHPKNHSEPKAILNAKENGFDTNGADIYLWGHWWCCKPCWDKMIETGIKDVYLLEDSENIFK
jgi:deoxycytidylate deaminase